MAGHVEMRHAAVRSAAFALLCLLNRENPRATVRTLENLGPFEGVDPGGKV